MELFHFKISSFIRSLSFLSVKSYTFNLFQMEDRLKDKVPYTPMPGLNGDEYVHGMCTGIKDIECTGNVMEGTLF